MVEDILADGHVRLSKSYVTVSDGVDLMLYDFCPEQGGDGKPVLVFVPGWVSLMSGWADVLKVLTPRMRVLYLETREKKSAYVSEGPLPDFSLSRMCQDLAEVIEQVLPENQAFFLAGSSLGSSLIIEYMNRADVAMPQKAILISPITDIDYPFWARIIIRFFPPSAYALIKHIIIFYLTRFRVDKRKEPEQAEKYTGTLMAAEPTRLKANAQALSDYSVWNRLESVRSEVVLVGAKTDKLHGLDALNKMVDLLPSARLVVMESNRETHSEKVAYLVVEEMES